MSTPAIRNTVKVTSLRTPHLESPEKSGAGPTSGPGYLARAVALHKLNDMYGFCTGVTCRHRAILDYFGQVLKKENCAACDVCLGNLACSEKFNALKLAPSGRDVLKGTGQPRLLKPAGKPAKVSKVARDPWENVNKGLFEELRKLRRLIADRKKVPAFVVFGDAALRDMARRRPGSDQSFLLVRGVGEAKCAQYADEFLKVIKSYSLANSLALDQF